MPGYSTNGLPPVGPPTQNGVAQTAPAGIYSHVGARALLAMDTETVAGATPQSVAVAAMQIAMAAMELIANQATSTVHAATLNTTAGFITTEALTTAAGATYTFTITNSLLVAGAAAPLVDIRNGTNTTPGMVVTSITNAVGSTVIVFTNNGSAALNGTMLIGFQI